MVIHINILFLECRRRKTNDSDMGWIFLGYELVLNMQLGKNRVSKSLAFLNNAN